MDLRGVHPRLTASAGPNPTHSYVIAPRARIVARDEQREGKLVSTLHDGYEKRVFCLATALAALLLVGCRNQKESAIAGPQSVVGEYDLSHWDSMPLPVDLGELPPKGGAPPCHQEVRSGHLTIAVTQDRYAYSWDAYSTCSNVLLQRGGSSGVVERDGNTLRFIADVGNGVTETHLGLVREDSAIEVAARIARLVFVRR